MKDLPLNVIPRGPYCYTMKGLSPDGGIKIDPCPYWRKDPTKRPHENGFCELLGVGDWTDPGGTQLLWDQVKECGINVGDEPAPSADTKESEARNA